MKTSPTQRSKKLLEQQGYTVAIVEKWNPHANIRQDLFGFIDLLAIHPEIKGCLGIQTTTRAHQADREKKALANENFQVWLSSGNQFHIHGWAKVGPRGQAKFWECNIKKFQVDQ